MDTKEFGAFVQLRGVRGNRQGLVHISQLSAPGGERVRAVQDVVKRNQTIKVKVVSIAGSRISLSMRDVDQMTGRDLNPRGSFSNPEAPMMPRDGGVRVVDGPAPGSGRTAATRKRLSSPQRWELKQLAAAGVLDPSEANPYADDDGMVEQFDEEDREEDLEIELVEEEPSFLRCALCFFVVWFLILGRL